MKLFFFLLLILLGYQSAVDPGYTVDIIGYSELGAPIHTVYNASTSHLPTVLILLNIHGDEAAGYHMGVRMLEHPMGDLGINALWVPTMNPDGLAYNTRENMEGIDLNRAFGDRCNRTESLSAVEADVMEKFIQELRPLAIVSYHMGAAVVVWGPDQDCNSTADATKAPMSSFEESLDTYWASRYAHHWGKGDESRTIQGSAMYQLSGSLLEYAVPKYTQLGLVVEMDRHKHPNDVLEEIVESQHRIALLAFLADIGKEAVSVLPECLKAESLFVDGNPDAKWFLTHGMSSSCK